MPFGEFGADDLGGRKDRMYVGEAAFGRGGLGLDAYSWVYLFFLGLCPDCLSMYNDCSRKIKIVVSFHLIHLFASFSCVHIYFSCFIVAIHGEGI